MITEQDWKVIKDWATILLVGVVGLALILIPLAIVGGIAVFLFRAIGGV